MCFINCQDNVFVGIGCFKSIFCHFSCVMQKPIQVFRLYVTNISLSITFLSFSLLILMSEHSLECNVCSYKDSQPKHEIHLRIHQ